MFNISESVLNLCLGSCQSVYGGLDALPGQRIGAMFEEQEGRQEESVVCGAFLSYLDLLLLYRYIPIMALDFSRTCP